MHEEEKVRTAIQRPSSGVALKTAPLLSHTHVHSYTNTHYARLSFTLSHFFFLPHFPLPFPAFPFSPSVPIPLSHSAVVSCTHSVTAAQKTHFCQPLIAQSLGSTGLATVTAASSENSSREAEKWRGMLSPPRLTTFSIAMWMQVLK